MKETPRETPFELVKVRKNRGVARSFATAKKPPPGKIGAEIAKQLDDIYWRMGGWYYNPDVLAQKKGGLPFYKKMREDDQIKACLLLKKSAIIKGGWKIETEQEEQEEFLEFMFERMEGTVDSFVLSLLSAYDYGFSVHEKVFEYLGNGRFNGKIGISALRPKSPTRIDFEVTEFGRLKPNGIVQTDYHGKKTYLPTSKFVLYTYQGEFDNPYGESDLKSAYTPWFIKTNVLRYWAMYLEKFAIPIIKGKTASGRITDVQKESFKTLLSKIQAGMNLLLPQDLDLEFLESGRVDRGVFQQAVDSMNVSIARSILIPQTIGLAPQTGAGSYARSEVDMAIFDWILGPMIKEVQDVINEQIIRQVIEFNFGEQEAYPKFKIRPLKEDDKARLVAAWSEAVARGAATRTVETEEYVRELLGFPEANEEEIGNIEKSIELAVEPPQAPGISGGNVSGSQGKVGNVPGKANQYRTMFVADAEKRIDWERVERDWNDVEAEGEKNLSKAFEQTIFGLVKDAKKNS